MKGAGAVVHYTRHATAPRSPCCPPPFRSRRATAPRSAAARTPDDRRQPRRHHHLPLQGCRRAGGSRRNRCHAQAAAHDQGRERPVERHPLNHDVRPNIVGLYNDILVPGSVPQPWEMQSIPHGAVSHFTLTTHIAQNLPVNQEPYIVYTPPGYDPKKPGGYPMLALLHGWSDNENGWTAVGQANLILDSLLAQGKIVPMIVVMPMGYGDYTFVNHGMGVWGDPKQVTNNVNIYSDMLLGEVLPAVQHDFAVSTNPDMHAIAGLSMGGLESVSIGLNHPEVFHYVIGMSSALQGGKFDETFPAFAAGNQNSFAHYKLLWIACGTEDGLITPNREFVTWAKKRNLPVTSVETPGQHTWLVWRDNLLNVAPLLFK